MKIYDKQDPLNRIVDVYAIYWATNPALKKFGQRMHLVGPYDGHDALVVVPEENAVIVDALVDGYFLQKLPDGRDILMHWAVKGGDLLEMLIEQNPEAMPELRRRILHGRP